jgi:hypothetical protein
MARYRVLQGIDYPPNKRAEVGVIVEDIPAQSVKWLLDSNIIEDADKPPKKIETPVVEEIQAEPVTKVEEPAVEDGFDPDATDGDGDGFLQDGTPHQRPVEEK